MRTFFRTLRARRGSETVEFALVMPVMIAMVFGACDYGLFFFEQLQATHALQQATRTGAMVKPTAEEEENASGCARCVSTVREEARSLLREIGADPIESTLTPQLIEVDGICVLDLAVDFEHDALIGFVGVPETYSLRVRLAAQGAKGC